MTATSEYQEAVNHALGGFQLLEESLKTYIEVYHDAVRKHLPPSMTYQHSRADIQDAALGRLVNVFAKISGNAALIARLRTQQKTRDELAHKALLAIYGGSVDELDLANQTAVYVKTAQQIVDLLRDVSKEAIELASIGSTGPGLLK